MCIFFETSELLPRVVIVTRFYAGKITEVGVGNKHGRREFLHEAVVAAGREAARAQGQCVERCVFDQSGGSDGVG